MEPGTRRRTNRRVVPRVSQACARCRKHKIRCDGQDPCRQCSKRGFVCQFDILPPPPPPPPPQRYVSPVVQRQNFASEQSISPQRQHRRTASALTDAADDASAQTVGSAGAYATPPSLTRIGAPEDEESSAPASEPAEEELLNPLLPGYSPDSYTETRQGQPTFYGTSSNWSFARRALSMVYQVNYSQSIPSSGLLFQGDAYKLNWDGRRDNLALNQPMVPTSDHAIFLIEAVKFHCGGLFHMYDEDTFMAQFHEFYKSSEGRNRVSHLWYIHFLMILAFGKAFVARSSNDRNPPGAEFFVPALKLLPDFIFLFSDPPQAIEVLSCAALYLQCIDFRSAAYNMIGQGLRLAMEQGMHTEQSSSRLSATQKLRCQRIWWTVYILDRRISSLMGSPSVADDEITAVIPTFPADPKKSLVWKHHVQLCRATASILQTVYAKDDNRNERFVEKMKHALRTVAAGSAERHEHFPLDLHQSSSGLCRLSAYLHIFEQQCLILATRPLLSLLLRRRLACGSESQMSINGSIQRLLRVCVNSAQKTITILKTMQDQGLLGGPFSAPSLVDYTHDRAPTDFKTDSFLSFDRESGFSSATVLSLVQAVDSSLLPDEDLWSTSVYALLDEMASRGNLIATFHRTELEQLNANLAKFLSEPRQRRPQQRQQQQRELAQQQQNAQYRPQNQQQQQQQQQQYQQQQQHQQHQQPPLPSNSVGSEAHQLMNFTNGSEVAQESISGVTPGFVHESGGIYDLQEWGHDADEFLAAASCFDDISQLGQWDMGGDLPSFPMGV